MSGGNVKTGTSGKHLFIIEQKEKQNAHTVPKQKIKNLMRLVLQNTLSYFKNGIMRKTKKAQMNSHPVLLKKYGGNVKKAMNGK
jgi:hypothetical protein